MKALFYSMPVTLIPVGTRENSHLPRTLHHYAQTPKIASVAFKFLAIEKWLSALIVPPRGIQGHFPASDAGRGM